MTLYTLRYNNYYNRIKKGFDTVAEYQPFVLDSLVETNYNPRDGVATTKTLNIADDKVPDYIIFADEDDTIVSRWFVIESNRNRRGQYTCSLLRDVIMDWKEQIYSAPSFIHKGYLRNNDSGIYNPEDIQVSQIKIGEILLKDKTNSAWLVGYMAAPHTVIDGETVPDTEMTFSYGVTEKTPSIILSSLEDWEYYHYTQEPLQVPRRRNMDITVDINRKYIWTLNRYGIVYTSKDGINWDEGQYLRMRVAQAGSYSNTLITGTLNPEKEERLLYQTSFAYSMHRTNILHWWIDAKER